MEINLFAHETKEISNRQRNINILKINFPITHINFPSKSNYSYTKLKKRALENAT